MTIFQRFKRKTKILKIKYLKRYEFIFKTGYKFKIKLDVRRDVDKLFYLDSFESSTLQLFSNLITPNNIIVDIGANIGVYSLIALSKYRNETFVYAFEPSDWAYNRLLENITLNSFNNVEIIKKAVSDHVGETEFHMCEDDAYNSLGAKPMKKVISSKYIELTTLDEFCKLKKIKKIDILKIDTEGADYLVLKGGVRILNGIEAPIIFCEYNRYTKADESFELHDMISLLESYQYRVYEINNKMLIPFIPEKSNADEIVCLKDEHLSRIPLRILKK